MLSRRRREDAGFNFNVGPRGKIAPEMAVEGEWRRCESERDLVPLRQWKHLAATFDSRHGIRLYVDGNPAGQLDIEGRPGWAENAPLRSLMNAEKVKPSDIHRQHGTLPGWFCLDGLIDEVKMHARALSPGEIAASFKANAPATAPELPLRVMPSGPKGLGRFGAYYCNLK